MTVTREFYINYVVCKEKNGYDTPILYRYFILTMWYVNTENIKDAMIRVRF
ncbi:hypothetical protein [Clostridioides difficile]|uniref:hypothetical protein n=1 Tax=Clostridioides difficile TaxID=1496 RepID=UPI003AB89091